MIRRRRPLLRAAAVGGTAYVAGRAGAKHAARESDQEARISDLEAQQAQPQYAPPPQAPPPTAPESGGSSMLDQLNQLSAMHGNGVLTDEEFAAAKAKLLG